MNCKTMIMMMGEIMMDVKRVNGNDGHSLVLGITINKEWE